jgi:hypothetical protein
LFYRANEENKGVPKFVMVVGGIVVVVGLVVKKKKGRVVCG